MTRTSVAGSSAGSSGSPKSIEEGLVYRGRRGLVWDYCVLWIVSRWFEAEEHVPEPSSRSGIHLESS